MSDEGFREIQLNGKQLVFLFMATTVVSVVIFLCGVLVGRGVRLDRLAPADAASAVIVPDPVEAQAQAPAAAAPTPSAEPPAPADELTYFERLQKNGAPREGLKSSSPEPAPVTAPAQPVPPPAPAPQPPAAPRADAHPAVATAGEPSGPGYAVQVAAYRDRLDADTLVKRLIAKGYPAFVMAPVKGAPTTMYRVRVGKYKDRREADAVFHRLETEEQFKPWILR